MRTFTYQQKIDDFEDENIANLFAAVTTRDEYVVTLHTTLLEASEAAINRTERGQDHEHNHWIKNGEIEFNGESIDYSCESGQCVALFKQETDIHYDVATFAHILDAWNKAFQDGLRVSCDNTEN